MWTWRMPSPARKRRASGPSQPEQDRERKVFTARLSPELAARIRKTARRDGVDVETVLREGLDAREATSA